MSQKNITFKFVTTEGERYEVQRLYHDSLVFDGIIPIQKSGIVNMYPHLDSIENSRVLIVQKDGKIIGTSSITDAKKTQTPADIYFIKEMEHLRSRNNKICAIWRTCTDPNYRRTPSLIKSIFQQILLFIIDNKYEEIVSCINPENETFYHKALKFNTIGRIKIMQDEPISIGTVLMHGIVKDIPKYWQRAEYLLHT